ncbi:MAG: hypothetical protein CL910_08795 [Deltaproteobacteria bacterium]|nr:hypothetical protein [Deltaproteobacteria bacterium]
MHRTLRTRAHGARAHRARLALAVLLACLFGPLGGLGCHESGGPESAVEVLRVARDPGTGSPVVLLREIEGDRVLPIWIGASEAFSIASRLEGQRPPRPNSHDLAKRLVDQLEGEVLRIVVTDLREGVYYALIRLGLGSRQFEIDARPSDAIALALRYDAPIFVSETLLTQQPTSAPDPQDEPLRLEAAPDRQESLHHL